jgi:hypothetical protein
VQYRDHPDTSHCTEPIEQTKEVCPVDFGKIKGSASGGGAASVLTDDFVAKNTQLNSVKALLERSGTGAKSLEELLRADKAKLDAFVKNISRFGNWQQMMDEAGKSTKSGGKGW